MPVYNEDNNNIYGSDNFRIKEIEEKDVPLSETLNAMWETENPIGSVLRDSKIFRAGGFDHDWSPSMEDNTGYEDNMDILITAENPEQLSYYKKRIDSDKANRQTIADSGLGANLTAGLGAALFDPLTYVPFVGAAKKFHQTGSVAKTALSASTQAGAIQLAEEGILHGTQPLRTAEESAFNVGGATVLTGVLGAGGAKLAANRFKEISDVIEQEVSHVDAGSAAVKNFDPVKDVMESKTTKADEELLSAAGVEKGNVSPQMRLANNKESVVANRLVERLTELPFYKNKHKKGIRSENNVVTMMKLWEAPLTEAEIATKSAFKAYSKKLKLDSNLQKMTEREFNERVAKAMRRNDTDVIPEISQSAKVYREKVYNPILKDAQKYGLIPEELNLKTASSYLTRRWNVGEILARKTEFEDKVSTWVKSNNDDMDWADVMKITDQVTANITQTQTGVLKFSKTVAQAGEYKLRTLDIPDHLIEEFLDNDIKNMSRNYVRHTTPELEMTRNGLSRDLVNEIDALKAEYKELIDAVEDNTKLSVAVKKKKIKKLNYDSKRATDDVEELRDLIYGTHNQWKNPQGKGAKLHKAAKQNALLALLGQMTVSAMSDSANIIIQNGLAPFSKSLMHFIGNGFKQSKLGRQQMTKMSVGLDMYRSGRIRAFADLDELDATGKFFELQDSLVDKFGKLTLMDRWNSFHKQFTGIMSMDHVINNAMKMNKGTLGKTQISKMARAGIDADMAKRIEKQFKKHGATEDNFKIANIERWTDEEAALSFKVSILKSVDWTINTPTQGMLPSFMTTKTGSILLQFKSFMFAAHQQTLIPALQIHDRAILAGSLFSVGLGGMAMTAKSMLSGRDLPDTPQEFLVEAIDQAGPLGLAMEINNTIDKFNLPSLQKLTGGEGARRFASRSPIATLAGAPIGQAVDAVVGMSSAFSGDMSRSDLQKLRKQIWLQNLPVVRQSMDAIEEGFADVLDLKGKRRPFTKFKEGLEDKF